MRVKPFSAMVSGRSWQSVKQGLGQTAHISKLEEEIIQEEISYWINEMTQVLENVPKELILIFKTNDLLRGLESTLNCRADANSFISMSSHCLKCMYEFDTLKSPSFSKWAEHQIAQWSIWAYKVFLKYSGKMKPVPEMAIESKENRMVDWHDSMSETSHV